MFGEAFDGNDQLVGSYTVPGELDSMIYFPQHYQVFHDVFSQASIAGQQKGTDQIASLWAARPMNYGTTPQANSIGIPPTKALINFLDNHDVSRFLFDAQGDTVALRNAMTLLMTEDGIPCLYYGTEQEFSGGNDPANREVLWLTGFPETGQTFQHFAKLATLRKKYLALRRGDTNVVYSTPNVAQETDAGIFAFERGGGDAPGAYALVVLNTNATKSSTTGDVNAMMVTAAPGTCSSTCSTRRRRSPWRWTGRCASRCPRRARSCWYRRIRCSVRGRRRRRCPSLQARWHDSGQARTRNRSSKVDRPSPPGRTCPDQRTTRSAGYPPHH